jgi:hypothetical protein
MCKIKQKADYVNNQESSGWGSFFEYSQANNQI